MRMRVRGSFMAVGDRTGRGRLRKRGNEIEGGARNAPPLGRARRRRRRPRRSDAVRPPMARTSSGCVSRPSPPSFLVLVIVLRSSFSRVRENENEERERERERPSRIGPGGTLPAGQGGRCSLPNDIGNCLELEAGCLTPRGFRRRRPVGVDRNLAAKRREESEGGSCRRGQADARCNDDGVDVDHSDQGRPLCTLSHKVHPTTLRT
jgi:hypothetical protein